MGFTGRHVFVAGGGPLLSSLVRPEGRAFDDPFIGPVLLTRFPI